MGTRTQIPPAIAHYDQRMAELAEVKKAFQEAEMSRCVDCGQPFDPNDFTGTCEASGGAVHWPAR